MAEDAEIDASLYGGTGVNSADPFHIAMGRDWLVNPYEVLPARYVKIGLRPAASLQMKPADERMNIKKYALRLNTVKVYTN